MVDIVKQIEVKSILSKSNLPIAGYSVNPYVGCPHACKYCYATFMKRFTNHKEQWGTFLDVKNWKAIKNPNKYKGETIILGSVTDAYHPLEEKFRRTRQFLEEMQGSGANLIITTKSDLVLRDFDLIKTYPDPLVSWSINTLDEEFQKDMDMASNIEARIEAMKQFHDAGIRTTCFISPIFPGITDVIGIIERVEKYCDYIWLENLNLRENYKATIMDYISEKYPEHMSIYKETYLDNKRDYWVKLDQKMQQYAEENDYEYVIDKEPFLRSTTGKPIIINYFYHEEIKQTSKNNKISYNGEE